MFSIFVHITLGNTGTSKMAGNLASKPYNGLQTIFPVFMGSGALSHANLNICINISGISYFSCSPIIYELWIRFNCLWIIFFSTSALYENHISIAVWRWWGVLQTTYKNHNKRERWRAGTGRIRHLGYRDMKLTARKESGFILAYIARILQNLAPVSFTTYTWAVRVFKIPGAWILNSLIKLRKPFLPIYLVLWVLHQYSSSGVAVSKNQRSLFIYCGNKAWSVQSFILLEFRTTGHFFHFPAHDKRSKNTFVQHVMTCYNL